MSAPVTHEPSEAVESSQLIQTVEGIPSAESGKPEEPQQISIQQICERLLQMERENVDAHIIGGRSYIWGMQYNIQLNICRTQSHLLP